MGEGAINQCPYPANMSGRNSFRTPGQWGMDMGLYKTFSLTERFKLQLKGEFFNLMNHSNLLVNGGSAEADNQVFGAPGTASVTAVRGGHGSALGVERRNTQLTIKLIF